MSVELRQTVRRPREYGEPVSCDHPSPGCRFRGSDKRATHRAQAVEYGIRPAAPAPPPRDPRQSAPRDWRDMLPEGSAVALYFGSEFCEDRLPNLGEAVAFCALARAHGLEPTLQTPLVTARGLRVVGALLDALVSAGWTPAVVFNDWGVLRLLRERHPALPLRAGRLVNRSLRDPRAYDNCGNYGNCGDDGNCGDAPAGTATHDASRFARLRRMLAAFGVTAVESDADLDGGYLGDGPDDGAAGLSRTLHLPFTFAASGRACPLKSALYPESDGFAHTLADPCPAPCRGRALAVRRSDTALPHWRAGNTLFYELPADVARAWLPHAERIVLHEMAAP